MQNMITRTTTQPAYQAEPVLLLRQLPHRPDPLLITSDGSLESAIRKAPAAPTSRQWRQSSATNKCWALRYSLLPTPAEHLEPFSTREVRVAHTPQSSPKPDAACFYFGKERGQSVSASLIAAAPKYGRHTPVQEPTPLSPTKRAALISQRRASATESQTGTAASTGLAAAHDPAPPAESKAVSGKTVKPIVSESQPNPLCRTPPKADPSVASSSGHSSQMHAEPAPGPVSAPAKRSAASIPAAATPKRRNLSARLPSKRQRVHFDSEENEDDDDGVLFLEVDLMPALCPGCQETFESPGQVVKHSCASSAYGEARCPFCPDKHLSSQGLTQHLAFKHFNHRFRCKECNVTKPFESLLLDHYANEHNDMHRLHPCPVKECPLIFKKAINLKRHLRTHAKSCETNFAPSSCSTPLTKPSASTFVSYSRPASMSSVPSAAKHDAATNSKTSDVTLTSPACLSTPAPVSSGAVSCDANSGQQEQDFVDMEDGMSSLSASPDPLPMSFADDDDENDDKERGIMLSEIKEQFARTLDPVDVSISITSQATHTPGESPATPAAAIEAGVSEAQADSLTANEPDEVDTVNIQFSAESPELPVSSHQPDQSVTSSSSAISYSHPISPESEPVSLHGISEFVSNQWLAEEKMPMPVPVGRPSLSKHSLSCLPDPVWRCDACGVMLFSESGHTCSADLMQLLTHNESNEVGVTLEDGFLCITLD